jgi:FADH2 O2-dependent halogenase
LLALWRVVLSSTYDLAVIGSGFGGSILAMCVARMGHSVILLEKGSHPRFVIGESSTPLSNLLLEEIANRYNLPDLKPLTKWGSWQRTYPHLACGLKRGFTFFHHDLQSPASSSTGAQSQLHVAASPNENIADTHWYRADLDEFLVHQAQAAGVCYSDQTHIQEVCESRDHVLLRGTRHDAAFEAQAQFIVDATGPRGLFHEKLHLPEAPLPGYPRTAALFGHFTEVKQLDSLPHSRSTSSPLYPTDDAAVHHVFEGGWIWVLRFNNGVTSAGVAAETYCSDRLGLRRGEQAWKDLLAKIPVLKEQFSEAKVVQPLIYTPQLSFRSEVVAGRRWALLPSAAGFVDPLLSTGFPLTLLGVERLAALIENHWASPTFGSQLETYASRTTKELLATSRLIAALYANMGNFAKFRSLSLLYFAAASFSETARRISKPHLAQSFLLHDHPDFGQNCRALLSTLAESAQVADSGHIAREVERIIDPIDVAGLTRRHPDSSYPMLAEDLIQSAWKLGATPADAVAMLKRTGFHTAGSSS